MAITRTPQIDDDGSGTTGTIWNNAWKTELYNQIDGVTGTPVAFAPTDASGASLVFSTATGTYVVCGPVTYFWGRVIYPTTSSGASAMIGLPFINGPTAFSGAFPTLASRAMFLHLPVNDGRISLIDPAGTAITNLIMSAAQVIFQGYCLV